MLMKRIEHLSRASWKKNLSNNEDLDPMLRLKFPRTGVIMKKRQLSSITKDLGEIIVYPKQPGIILGNAEAALNYFIKEISWRSIKNSKDAWFFKKVQFMLIKMKNSFWTWRIWTNFKVIWNYMAVLFAPRDLSL